MGRSAHERGAHRAFPLLLGRKLDRDRRLLEAALGGMWSFLGPPALGVADGIVVMSGVDDPGSVSDGGSNGL